MARQRLGVVLLIPQPLATQIDGVRRALGDSALDRIAPHITLVPPVNVTDDDLPDALEVVRSAAAAIAPLSLRLGPVATFQPRNPVVYLSVGGAETPLSSLRASCLVGPLARPDEHDFVPHVTIARELAADRIQTVETVLADLTAEVAIDRVHVLAFEESRIWVPIADMPLGSGHGVVGRGSLPLEVSVSERTDPEAAALFALEGEVVGQPFAVAARRDGAVVAASWGWTSGGHLELAELVVAAAHRREGIGRHVLASVEAVARERGCIDLGTVAPPDGAAAAFLRASGWRLVEGRRWERLLD